MTQALHIFRKDLRHLWPECGVYVLLLLVFGIAAPQAWSGSGSTLVQTALRLLAFLIPVAFFVLIVRVIHEERLVGVEQFWITRPYRWTSLLIAKCIFILACVILPLVLMQYWLLSRAGLGLLASSPALSRSMLIACVHALIPFMLVAAITATLTEAFMILVGMVVAWLCALLTFFGDAAMNMSPPSSWEILAALFTILLTSVLVYQYARRRTSQSRVVLIVIVVLFMLLLYGFSGAHFGTPVRAMIRSQYPLPSESSLRLVALPGPVSYADREKDMHVPKDFVEVKLPIRLEGLPSDYKLRNTNVSLTLDVQGSHYTSPWQTANVGFDVLSFLVPQKVFDRAAERDAHLHLELLAEKLRPGASQVITATDSFSVPNNGRCILNSGVTICWYAFRMLVPTRVQASEGQSTCGASHSNKPAYASLHVIPDGGRIDPVIRQDVLFESKICPGSQLTFSQYRPAGNFRLELDLPSIEIAQYKAR
jgi:hypothetical protein